MANGWQTDPYGNQVWMPINPGADPGTAWSATELGEVESLLGEDLWGDYGGYFDPYGTGEFYEKEKLQRVGAGIDIGQLGKAWDLKAGQLGDVWGTETTGAWGELFRQREGAGTTWDLQRGELFRGAGGAQTLWGLQRGELERGALDVTETWRLQEEDILRKELEASGLWAMQKGGLEEGWKYKKGELGRGARSGLRKAISSQETVAGKVGFARAGTSEFRRMQKQIRAGYGMETTEGERVLAQNLGIGEEQLSQTLDAYASQRGIGKEQLTQALAGITGQVTLGEEQMRQTLAGIGYELDPGGELIETGAGKLAAGEEALRLEQDRIGYLISSGQMTYDQAIESGQFQVGAGITDIGQTLQENVWQTRQDWREQQRSTLHMLLGMDIFGEDGNIPTIDPTNEVVVTDPNLDEQGEYDWGLDYDFDWYGDDWGEEGGWGEDYEYDDYWEFESDYS